jgi:nitroreductase
MDLTEGLLTRRSIRKYTGALISDEDILEMVKAGMYAPSANNRRPWQFIIVSDRAVMNEIIAVHPYAAMLAEASHAIVVCGDRNLQGTAMYYPLDCSAATQNILLAAHAMGYGAVWLGVYPREERVKQMNALFRLPAHVEVISIISVGVPVSLPEKQPGRFEPEKIKINHWPQEK